VGLPPLFGLCFWLLQDPRAGASPLPDPEVTKIERFAKTAQVISPHHEVTKLEGFTQTVQAKCLYILLTGFPENQHNPACFPSTNTCKAVLVKQVV
jgi:hypothetical protein